MQDSEAAPVLRVVPFTPGVAFVGTYPPRRCGIATFTRDLSRAMLAAGEELQPMALALTDPGGQYEYPREVRYEIRQGVRADYERAAEFINYSDVRLVSIQHEYGLFGGDDGAYILDFLAALRVPAIATLHTVLERPSEGQRAIVRRMAERCGKLVVMSGVGAQLLARSYGVTADQVTIIPHGIPDMERGDARALKERFGVGGHRMLLTFGLLSPNKGIETVIRALPQVVKEFPDVKYFVVGLTHPVVARRYGEIYRSTLEREAAQLGVRKNVVFRDQFVTDEELCSYLQAADIFISPYLNEAQVTSGALSYAMGAGAAVVSTPYWHAQELLAEGRGRLFPFGDAKALGDVLVSLLRSPLELAGLRSASHDYSRAMLWPRVGRRYLELGGQVMHGVQPTPVERMPPAASSLPELRLDHLLRLTDDTGIIQHACFNVPARNSGYCVDDNARALIVALEAERLNPTAETRRLITTYLSYLHVSQRDDGDFDNLMSYRREVEVDSRSDDCLGRAMWALGSAVALETDDGHRRLARSMLLKALPRLKGSGPRGQALAILGLARYLAVNGDSVEAREALAAMAEQLVERFQNEANPDWRWFEPTLTYDNALLPLALFQAYSLTGDRASLRVARETLEFLEEICFDKDQLVLVGNAGWHSRGKAKPAADEQATDATAFVLAFRAAFVATADSHYLRRMQQAFSWFLGTNRLSEAMYDFASAGCRDGLGETTPNQNQGAESTISFLLALLQMLDVAGEAPGHRPDPQLVNN